MKKFAPAALALILFCGAYARGGETCDVSVKIPGAQVVDLARPYIQNYLDHPEKLQKSINDALEKLGTARTYSFEVPGLAVGNLSTSPVNVQMLFQNVRVGKLGFGQWDMTLVQTPDGPAYQVHAKINQLMIGTDTQMMEVPSGKKFSYLDKPNGPVRLGLNQISKDFDGRKLRPNQQFDIQFLVRLNETGRVPLKADTLEYVPDSVKLSMPFLEVLTAPQALGEISKVLGDDYHPALFDEGVCPPPPISPQTTQLTHWWSHDVDAVTTPIKDGASWVGGKVGSAWEGTKTGSARILGGIPIDEKDRPYVANQESLLLLSALKEFNRYQKMTPEEKDKLGYRESKVMQSLWDTMPELLNVWKKSVLQDQLAPLLAKNISDTLSKLDIFGDDMHEFPLVQKAHITGGTPYLVEMGGFYAVQNLRVAKIDPNGDVYLGADGCRVDGHFVFDFMSTIVSPQSAVKTAAEGEKQENQGFVIPRTIDANLSYRMINDYIADSFEYETDHQFQINGHSIQVETPPKFETIKGPDGKPVMRITMSVTEQEYAKYTQYYLGLPLKARPELTVKEKDGKVDLSLDPSSLLNGLPDDSTHSTIAGIDTGHTSSGRFKSELERKYSDLFKKLFELDLQKKFNINLQKFEPTPDGQGIHLIFDLPGDLDFKSHSAL